MRNSHPTLKTITSMICLLLLATNSPAGEQEPQKPLDTTPMLARPVAPAREMQILAQLRAPTELDLPGIPLQDALDYLEDLHHIEIWIDEKALTDIGVAMDAPINLGLSGVKLSSALALMLTPLNLDYVIEDEVMKITTREIAGQTFAIRRYEFTSAAADSGIQPLHADYAREIIQKLIQPQSWTENGPAAIVPLSNGLLIKQTQQAHEEIEELLRLLAESTDPSFDDRR